MAFPVDSARATTNSTTSGTSHSLNLPGSISSGDILLAVVRCPASTTISWPAGWTEWEQNNSDASDDETSIAYRYADGSEGATITITLGTSRILVGLCYKITGGVGIAFSAATVGSATQPNSTNLTGILQSARDILWITIGGCDDAETLTSAPTSYSNGVIQASTATGTSGCTVYGASRQLNATSEDPGAFTLGSTSIWTAWTVAISDTAFPSKVSQLPVEAIVLPTSQEARVSQIPVEAILLPTSQEARVSQLVIEAIIQLPKIISPGAASATAGASGIQYKNNDYIAIGNNIGTANSKASGTTVTITTTHYALPGDMVVVMTAWDNNNNVTITGPDNDTWTVTDSASNTYDFIAGAEDASTNNRCAAGILVSYLTNPLPIGSTITVTYNSTRTAKAALAQRIVFRPNTVSGYRLSLIQHEHNEAGDVSDTNLYFTGLDGANKIILHALAAEGPNTDNYTWDTDYTYLSGDGTTGSTDDTNMHIRGGIRIGDTSLTQDTISTTSTTADRDYTQLWAVLYPIPVGEQPIPRYDRIYDNTAFTFREYAGGTARSGGINILRAAENQLCPVKGIPVGAFVVVMASYGNKNTVSTTGPGDEDLAITDISGNTWTKQAGAQIAISSENGTWAAIVTSVITNEIPKGGWIKATTAGGSRLTNRALAAYVFTAEDINSITRADRVHAHNTAQDPSSLTLSNLVYRKYLLLHCMAAEAPPSDTYTWDSDYTQLTSIGNDDGGVATNSNTLLGSYRIADLTGDTIDVASNTADRDYTQLLTAFYTNPIPRIDVRLGG